MIAKVGLQIGWERWAALRHARAADLDIRFFRTVLRSVCELTDRRMDEDVYTIAPTVVCAALGLTD